MSQAMPAPAPKSPAPGPGYPPYQQPPSRSMAPCLIGCGITGLVVLLLCGGTIWYVTSNFKNIAVNLVASTAKKALEDSQMRPEDKKEVIAQIDRVAEGYKKNQINEQELGKIMEGMAKSPLMVVLIVYGVTYDYINRQDADGKAEAERTLQRIARGTA